MTAPAPAPKPSLLSYLHAALVGLVGAVGVAVVQYLDNTAAGLAGVHTLEAVIGGALLAALSKLLGTRVGKLPN